MILDYHVWLCEMEDDTSFVYLVKYYFLEVNCL